jgi:hypothetical protein
MKPTRREHEMARRPRPDEQGIRYARAADPRAPHEPPFVHKEHLGGRELEVARGTEWIDLDSSLHADQRDIQTDVLLAQDHLRDAHRERHAGSEEYQRGEQAALEGAEIDRRLGRADRGRPWRLPSWVDPLWLSVAIPGELVALAGAFHDTPPIVGSFGAFENVPLGGLLLAAFMTMVIAVAGHTTGIMGAQLLRDRSGERDRVVTVVLPIALAVGILLSSAAVMARIDREWDEFEDQVAELTASGLPEEEAASLAGEPSTAALGLQWALTYFAFFAMTSVIAGLSWDPDRRRRQELVTIPAEEHQAAITEYLDAAAELAAVVEQRQDEYQHAIDDSDAAWHEIAGRCNEFWMTVFAVLGDAATPEIRRLSHTPLPATAAWRSRTLDVDVELLDDEVLAWLMAGPNADSNDRPMTEAAPVGPTAASSQPGEGSGVPQPGPGGPVGPTAGGGVAPTGGTPGPHRPNSSGPASAGGSRRSVPPPTPDEGAERPSTGSEGSAGPTPGGPESTFAPDDDDPLGFG